VPTSWEIDVRNKVSKVLGGNEFVCDNEKQNPDPSVYSEKNTLAIFPGDDSSLQCSAEAKVLGRITGDNRSVEEHLDDLSNIDEQLLTSRDIDLFCRRLGIFNIDANDVVLPPDGHPPINIPGDFSINDSTAGPGHPKLGELIRVIRGLGVSENEITVVKGVLRSDQMRDETYLLVEIPRLNRSIFICNAYAEATYVYKGLLSRICAFTYTKSDLKNQFGDKVVEIHFDRDYVENWRERLKGALGDNIKVKKQAPKVDIRNQEKYRKEVTSQFPDPKVFMKLGKKDHRFTRIHGLTLMGVANNVFGLSLSKSPSVAPYERALFARVIYREGHDCIDSVIIDEEKAASMTPKDWKQEILTQFPKAEDFMKLNPDDRQDLKISGKGLQHIAKTVFKLNIERGKGPCSNSYAHALLAKAIYGEGHDCIDSVLWTPDQWREEIKRRFSTPEDFMKLTGTQRDNLKMFGNGLVHIANTVFKLNLENNPCTHSYEHALLARAIYEEEGHECIEKVIREYEGV
jgi:hypothetical protein